MQRAAATAAAKETSQPPSTEGSNTPTPKRQRFAPGEQSQSPAATPSKDLEAISAALAAEEEKRREAIARQAAESGETEWVLDFGAENPVNQYAPPPFIVTNDSLDADDDDDLVYGGRQAYGNFKRKKKIEVCLHLRAAELVLLTITDTQRGRWWVWFWGGWGWRRRWCRFYDQ